MLLGGAINMRYISRDPARIAPLSPRGFTYVVSVKSTSFDGHAPTPSQVTAVPSSHGYGRPRMGMYRLLKLIELRDAAPSISYKVPHGL
jgi:hypothetical protein